MLTSGPRFASTNLGTFICTRCAGLHRRLGVHVTKVKSISHDAWTADQVQFMQQTGNKKAKEKCAASPLTSLMLSLSAVASVFLLLSRRAAR